MRIRLFAVMAEAGGGAFELELAEGARVGDVKGALLRLRPGIKWPPGTMVAVNMEYAGDSAALRAGDEVAVIPPVSGGSC